MPHPSLLHPEPPPLRQSTADPYLHRRCSNIVLSQSLWGLGVLVHKVLFVPARVYFPVLCEFWQLYCRVNGNLQQEGLWHT